MSNKRIIEINKNEQEQFVQTYNNEEKLNVEDKNLIDKFGIIYFSLLKEILTYMYMNNIQLERKYKYLLNHNSSGINDLSALIKKYYKSSYIYNLLFKYAVESIQKNIIHLNNIINELHPLNTLFNNRSNLSYIIQNEIFEKTFEKYINNNGISLNFFNKEFFVYGNKNNNIQINSLNELINNLCFSVKSLFSLVIMHSLESTLTHKKNTFMNELYKNNYIFIFHLWHYIYSGLILYKLLLDKDIKKYTFGYKNLDKLLLKKEDIEKIHSKFLNLLIETKKIYNKQIDKNKKPNHNEVFIDLGIFKTSMQKIYEKDFHNEKVYLELINMKKEEFNNYLDILIKVLEIAEWALIANITKKDLKICYNFVKQKNDMETLLKMIKKTIKINNEKIISNEKEKAILHEKLYKCEELIKEFSELIKENSNILIIEELSKQKLSEREQETLNLVLQKRNDICDAFIEYYNNLSFSEKYILELLSIQ